jgi:hypothetical protein
VLAWTPEDAVAAREHLAALAAGLPDLRLEDSGNGHTRLLNRAKGIGWLLVDHHGDGLLALWLKSDQEEQTALVAQDPRRYFVPQYVGKAGWIGVRLDPAADPDWDEIAALLQHAWRLTARRTALREYDAAHPPVPPG